MAHFAEELTVTQMADRYGGFRLWKLHEPLVYEIDNAGRSITVPAGFISDGPTIPRVLWVFFPVWGSWGRAGVLHDYLIALIAIGKPHPYARTRVRADLIFYRAMQSLNVGFMARHALCFGVRVGTLFNIRPESIDYNHDLLRQKEREKHGPADKHRRHHRRDAGGQDHRSGHRDRH
jgi:hypothetical protein